MSYGQGPNPFGDKPPQGGNPYAPPAGGWQPQGGPPGGPMPPGSVPNHLGWAIFCLICCGGLFAVPAIIYASQVNSKLQIGDYRGAVEASENAKKWCMIAMVIGVVCGGLGTVAQIMLAVAGNQ